MKILRRLIFLAIALGVAGVATLAGLLAQLRL